MVFTSFLAATHGVGISGTAQNIRKANMLHMQEHRLADTRLTPLFVSSGQPLMWLTSGPTRPVIFPLFLLNPVNCSVAPRAESMSDPAKPPKSPADSAFHLFHPH